MQFVLDPALEVGTCIPSLILENLLLMTGYSLEEDKSRYLWEHTLATQQDICEGILYTVNYDSRAHRLVGKCDFIYFCVDVRKLETKALFVSIHCDLCCDLSIM